MAIPNNLCIELPQLGEIPKVSLPLGAQLSGVVDFANSLPTDCSVNMNLFGSVSLALGNVQCLMAVMEVFQKLKDILDPVKFLNFTNLLDLAEPLGKLAECFLSITPAAICVTIKDVLQAIVKILRCVVEEAESIIEFQASLDVEAAASNPKLAAILLCAKANADTSSASLFRAIEPLVALLNLMSSLPGADQVGIPTLPSSFGVSAQTPSLESITDVSAIRDVLNVLRDIVNTLDDVISAVPC